MISKFAMVFIMSGSLLFGFGVGLVVGTDINHTNSLPKPEGGNLVLTIVAAHCDTTGRNCQTVLQLPDNTRTAIAGVWGTPNQQFLGTPCIVKGRATVCR